MKHAVQSVDLSSDQYAVAIGLIPVSAWKEMHKDGATLKCFVDLESFSHRCAPEWNRVQQLSQTLHTLLDASGGKNVKQQSFAKAIVKWGKDSGISMQQLDRCAFTIRTLIIQMTWHKSHGRSVPKSKQHACSTLFDKILADGLDDTQDTGETTNMCSDLDEPDTAEPEADGDNEATDVESISSEESLGTLRRKVLGSDAPIAPPDDPSPAPPPGGAAQSMDEIREMAEAHAEAEVSPRQWAALNKAKKAIKKKKTEKPEKKTEKPTKPMKAMKSLKQKPAAASDWERFLKRAHSKAYHKELTYNTKQLNMSVAQAKVLAQQKGRAVTDQLRHDQREGTLADFPACAGAGC